MPPCTPVEPAATPFTGEFITADYIRLGVVILAAFVVFEAVVAFWREIRTPVHDSHRLAFHLIVALSAVQALGTEWGRLGHVMTWRLMDNATIVILATWAMWWRLPWAKDYRTNAERLRGPL